ncbi:MAG: chemotaxis protein CheC [Oscillospiraceae bacterium]|nr:chemotaxis protein CheC [Oscillospiraceae bacterium]
MADRVSQALSGDREDVFRELGSIGAGNAATALAGMLGKRINMNVPEVSIIPFNEVPNIMGGADNIVVGVLVNMRGQMNGYVLLLLGIDDAYSLLSAALQEKKTPPENFYIGSLSELESSALVEISNILVGSYLSAIITITNLSIKPSVPEIAVDMAGAILNIVAVSYGHIGDSVLFLKTQFTSEDSDMTGNFFLIPDFSSYKILMASLGIS